MIQKLKFNVTFTTGKYYSGEHDFLKGMSAITGPNESGKSLRLEMIRLALFGTKALRASMSTVAKLNVEMSFTINDIAYSVSRTKTNASLFKEGQQIVVGTSPVNAEIIRLLGYNMEVFDTTNACLQGKVEALSDKKPTERRRMVDKVIGLDVVDTLITETTTELSTLRPLLASLENLVNRALTEPEKDPEAPETSAVYNKVINDLQEKYKEKFVIEATLKALFCEKKDLPEVNESDEEDLRQKIFTLEANITNLDENLKKVESLQTSIAKIPVKDVVALQQYLDEDIQQQWINYTSYKILEREDPKCSLDNLKYFKEYLEQVEIQRKIDKLKEGMSTQCPKCLHVYSLDREKINELEQQLNTKIDWKIWTNKMSDLGITNLKQIDKLEEDIRAYEHFISLPVVLKPEKEFIDTKDVVTFWITLQEQREVYVKELAAMPQVTMNKIDLVAEVNALQLQFKTLLIYKKYVEEITLNNEKYEKYIKYKEDTTEQLRNLVTIGLTIEEFNSKLSKALIYENKMIEYKVQLEQNTKLLDQISAVETQIKDHTNLRNALNDLKPRVKQYLVPSLNRVASNLLSQMTSGARTKVVIDENFEISIDDQPIDTLSGSGKAVSNLAIRIGLGTVLTNKVFSVFLADEIDASMDQDRVAYTAECLKNLTKTIDQIILVSHKKPDADHQIEL